MTSLTKLLEKLSKHIEKTKPLDIETQIENLLKDLEKYNKRYILLSPSRDCYENLVLEELIVKSGGFGKEMIFLYQNANTAVIGRNQNIYEEINFQKTQDLNINYYRRLSGGGAVYQDEGNLCFSFIGSQTKSYQQFLTPVIDFLRTLGKVDVRFEGRNDLLLNGAKVSGSAQFIQGKVVCHHGTLLYDVNLGLLSEILQVKAQKLSSKGIKSIRQRVVNIKGELGETAPKTTIEFAKKMLKFFKQNGYKEIPQSVFEKARGYEAFQKLVKERKSKEWIFGTNPTFEFSNQEKFEGGFVKVELNVKNNVIQSCAFSGDFLSTHPVESVAKKLEGTNFEISAIEEILKTFKLSNYFGNVKLEELLSLFQALLPK